MKTGDTRGRKRKKKQPPPPPLPGDGETPPMKRQRLIDLLDTSSDEGQLASHVEQQQQQQQRLSDLLAEDDDADTSSTTTQRLADLLAEDDDTPNTNQRFADLLAEDVDDVRVVEEEKKNRENNPVRIPVHRTLLPGSEYAHGALQLAPQARALARRITPPPVHVLPPRREQNEFTLMSPTLKPMSDLLPRLLDRTSWGTSDMTAHEIVRQLYAPRMFERTMTMLRNPDATPAQLRAARLVEATTPEQLALAVRGDTQPTPVEAPQLLGADLARQQRSVRLIDPALGVIHSLAPAPAPSGTAVDAHHLPGDKRQKKGKHLQQVHFQHEREQAQLRYYVEDDPEPDPELPHGLQPPLAYPAVQGLSEMRAAARARHTRMREAAEHLPHASVVAVTREHLDRYRLPLHKFPREEQRAPCCNGLHCRVYQLARKERREQWGYNPPAFLLPRQEEKMRAALLAGGHRWERWLRKHNTHPGPCIECTLANWTEQVLMGQLPRKPPEHPINTFQVSVGEGEYCRDVLLPTVIDGVRTGVEGHVPVYDECYRQFESQPGDTALLREVNVDFHRSLSQTNACLGVPKSRPLAGYRSTIPLPFACLLQTTPMGDATSVSLLWQQYVRALPMPLLADRAFFAAGTQTFTRVPVLCLRRSLLSINTTSLSREIVQTLRCRVAPQVTHALARLFRTPNLEATLGLLAWQALHSFEHALNFVLSLPPDAPVLTAPLQMLCAYKELGDWAGQAFSPLEGQALARQPSFSRTNTLQASHVLYATCLWRIAVATLFCSVLRCTDAYQTRLFIATHFDLLTVCCALDHYDDRLLLQLPDTDDEEPYLSRLYPQSTRVCCAEELPGLTPLFFATNLWYDMPSKKQHTSMRDTLAHLYLKARNHVCQRRGTNNIAEHAMATYPAIQAFVTLVMRCVWLGLLPHARGRPSLPASLKINATFAPLTALLPGVTVEMERAQQVRIRAWVKQHPMLTLSMLREHYFYVLESAGTLDEAFAQTRHWHYFKAVARMANCEMRRALNNQVQWDVLEERIENKESHGEVARWHEKQKEHNTKLLKALPHEIMIKKMTNVEKDVSFDLPAVRAWAAQEGLMETMHTIAWGAAHAMHQPLADNRMRSAVPTGMSQRSYRQLREWNHSSDEYHTSDDNFAKLARAMYEHDWRDFVCLKVYLRLVEYYLNDVLGFTCVEHMRAQAYVLRLNLTLPGFVRTPETLGYGYFCEGCNKWAHPIARPSREYLGMPLQSDRRHRQRHLAAMAPKKTIANKKKVPRPWDPKPMYTCDARAACKSGVAFNPLDQQLYCTRGYSTTTTTTSPAAAAAVAVAGDTEDEEEDDEVEEEEEEDDPMALDLDTLQQEPVVVVAAVEPEKKKEKASKPDIARAVVTNFHCQAPLVAVDLMGAYKRLQRRLYTLCVYCGRPCEVIAANVTNHGQSCGEHALVHEYPLYHRLWRHIHLPPTRDLGSPIVRMCDHCGHYDALGHFTFWVHDVTYRMARVTLCRYHAGPARQVLPKPHLGEQMASLPVHVLRAKLLHT